MIGPPTPPGAFTREGGAANGTPLGAAYAPPAPGGGAPGGSPNGASPNGTLGGTPPAAPAAPRAPGGAIHTPRVADPAEVLGAIRRGWRWVLGGVLVGVAGAVGYMAYKPPVYEATASVRVEDRRAPTPEVIRTVTTSEDEVATEIDVMRSRTLAGTVIDSLGLRLAATTPARTPRAGLLVGAYVPAGVERGTITLTRRADGAFDARSGLEDASGVPADGPAAAVLRPGVPGAVGGVSLTLARGAAAYPSIILGVTPQTLAVERMLRALTVTRPGTRANLVVLSFRHPDPALARDVLNVWTGEYVAQRTSVQKIEARSTAAFLRAQIDTLSRELDNAEGALRSYRERERVVDPQVEASTAVTRLSSVRAERDAVEAERSSLAGLLDTLKASASAQHPDDPSPWRRLVGFPTMLRNPAMTGLLTALLTVDQQRSDLVARRSPRDPDVLNIVARQHALEEELRRTAETYAQGLGAQVASLDQSLGRGGAALGAVPGHEQRLAQLQRTPRVLEELVTMLQTRLKEAQIAQAVEDPSVRVVDAAVLPWRPAAPRRPMVFALGLVAGLFAGVALACLVALRDNRVHSAADVRAVSSVPTIGMVPRLAVPVPKLIRPADGPLKIPARTGLAALRRNSLRLPEDEATVRAVSEAVFERLYVDAAYARAGGPPRTLVLTSALPGEGKSTTAALLATTMTRAGRQVLLIDADLRRGVVPKLLGLTPGAGTADVLAGTHQLRDVVQEIDVGGGILHAVPPGGPPSSPVALLTPDRIAALMAAGRSSYDLVIVDAPPATVVADAALLGVHADSVLVVARARTTARPELAYALELLARVRAPVLGVVLNDVDLEKDAAYDGSYRHMARAYAAYAGSAA